MRGVVCGGMVSALEELGLRDVFDSVYGASAGAMASAYFIAGQARLGTTIYYEDINNEAFISKRRLLSSNPIMNTSFLLRSVCESIKPLSYENILKSPIQLNILSSCVEDRKSEVFRNFQTKEEIIRSLEASINVPGIAGTPVKVNGKRYTDASVYQSIPFQSVLDDGATHILVLMTRPIGVSRTRPGLLKSLITRALMSQVPPYVVDDFLTSYRTYIQEVDRIKRLAEEVNASTKVACIQLPVGSQTVGQLEKDASILINGALAGFKATYVNLGYSCPLVAAAPSSFDSCRPRIHDNKD